MVASKKGTKKAAKKAAKKATAKKAAAKKPAPKKASQKAPQAEAKCNLTKDEVTERTLTALRRALDDDDIEADTDFEDLGVDTEAKALLFFDLRDALEGGGCQFKSFGPGTCEKADTPQDMIDAICKDFGIS